MSALAAREEGQGAGAPWLSLVLATACVALYVALGAAAPALTLDRDGLVAGQVWRVLTGHLVHVDPGHLAWNVGALLVLGAIAERAPAFGWRRLLAAWLAGCAGATAAVLLGASEILRYCGASGALNAPFAALMVVAWTRGGGIAPPLLLLGGALKIAVEAATGTALATDASWPSVWQAHAGGFAAGVLAGAWTIRSVARRRRSSTDRPFQANLRWIKDFRASTHYMSPMSLFDDIRRSIIDEAKIGRLVEDFYAKARRDPELGPIFEAHVDDWPKHLEILKRFWSSVALGTGVYHGSPMQKHVALREVAPEHFARWLELFEETASEVFAPRAAALFVERAHRIARSLQLAMFYRPDAPKGD